MKSIKRAAPRRTFWQTPIAWVLVLLVLLAGGGAVWYFFGGGSAVLFPQSAQQSGPSYHTATVRRGNIQISASGSGSLVANQSVDLSFSTKGTVTELNVKLGDTVKAGQVLARLGNAEALQANVASYQLQLLQAQQALTTLQQNASVSFAQSYQDWITAQQAYNNAVTTQQRSQLPRCSKEVRMKYASAVDATLQKLNSITKENYGSDQYIAAKSAYDTAVANNDYCAAHTQDEQTTAQSALDVAKVNLQQAEAKYNTLKAASGVDPNQLALDEATVTNLTAQLAKAESDLNGIILTAPMDGKVVYLAASQGAVVGTTKFITIADMSHPTVQVNVDETDMGKLAVGSTAQITFDALPEQPFTGKVVQVDPQLVTSGQYQVAQGLIELDPASVKTIQNVPLGLNASVTVVDQQANNVLLVPVQALKNLGNNEYAVFVVNSDEQLRLIPVKVGLMDTTQAEITSGLKVGDIVSTGIVQTTGGNAAAAVGSNTRSRQTPNNGNFIPGQ